MAHSKLERSQDERLTSQRHSRDESQAIMRALNILCLGDSLTHGFPSDHPYAWTLQSSLESTSSYLKVTTDEQGLDGDMAISPPGQFYLRIKELCECSQSHLSQVCSLLIFVPCISKVTINSLQMKTPPPTTTGPSSSAAPMT